MVRLVGACVAWVMIGVLRFYKLGISPFLPAACRFSPTCSDYFAEAVKRHGVWKGAYLGVGRLLRCHPWGGRGYDPVP